MGGETWGRARERDRECLSIIGLLCKSISWGRANNACAQPVTPHPYHFSYYWPDLQCQNLHFSVLLSLVIAPRKGSARELTLLSAALNQRMGG